MAIRTRLKKNYCVFDGSYLLHHASSSAYNSWKDFDIQIDGNLSDHDFTQDADYVDIFTKKLTNSILGMLKDNKSNRKHAMIALDCSKYKIWRRDYFPAYKENRIDRDKTLAADTSKPNLRPMWGFAREHILPTLNIALLGYDRLEGDDVIAIVTNYVRKHTDNDVVIVANDGDLLQLCSDRVDLKDLYDESKVEKTLIKYALDTPCQLVPMKIISGDKKDNVPQIITRCGAKTAKKYRDDPNMLLEYYAANPHQEKAAKLNRVLLDLRCIPPIYVKEVVEDLKVLVK